MTRVGLAGHAAPITTVLIDDVRRFRDARPCLTARSSVDGVALLHALHGQRIEHLWLDHDLSGNDDIWPVIRMLEDAFLAGEPFDRGVVHVHASRSGPAHRLGISMRRLGCAVERPTDPRIFTR